ncbi:MAG: GntR family transcriptional regulator [Streptosporangiaceae bacterium]|nr:GntR family transcriptional regulator [Streptosporangiaceae bacterium]
MCLPTFQAMDEIDHDGPDPLYQQVAAIIAGRIAAGLLVPGRPIPSETHMQQEFGVARTTARKAVALLRDQGLVRTVTGKGSYVLGEPSEDA